MSNSIQYSFPTEIQAVRMWQNHFGIYDKNKRNVTNVISGFNKVVGVAVLSCPWSLSAIRALKKAANHQALVREKLI